MNEKLSNYVIERESERLVLKTLMPDDVSGDYVSWFDDSEITQYLEVRHSLPQTHEKVTAFVDNMLQSENDLMLGIFLKEDGKHIGNIKLGPINWLYGRSDIGLMIGDKNSWGKGYATEAIETISNIAFKDIGLKRVQAGAYSSNKGSVKAFLKAGFEQEGVSKGYWALDEVPEDDIRLAKLA